MLGLVTALTLAVLAAPPSDCEALVMMTEESHGLLWILPGAAQAPAELKPVVRAFREAGVRSEIRVHDWNRPFGMIANVVNHERNFCYAACVAKEIAEWSRLHPDEPIDLVGYSGGGGLAIMVAEALPEEVRIRHIVLAQPAISPTHDLTATLGHVDGKLVHFRSPHDWVILHLGTRIFGTIDRKHVVSSGKVGFDLEKAVPDEKMRHLLEDRPWTPEMIRFGHYGGHPPITFPRWNREYVAPYLLPDCSDSEAKKKSPTR